MAFYFCKLFSPRPTFPGDITPEEGALMQAHGQYWHGLAERGTAVAVGPVMDPAGAFGFAFVEVEDEAAARALTEADPVIRAGAGFRFETYPVPQAILRTSAPTSR
jgi:uncharacterized protein YciI